MNPPRILVIEDDLSLNEQLSQLLRNNDFEVEQAFDGENGLITALKQDFDLILLDVLLPERDGFSVLEQVRKSIDTPVIMLTACNAEEERIKGLSIGADDYLAKPFNLKELSLRIEAILRRCSSTPSNAKTQYEITLDELKLNKRNQTAVFGKEEVNLTPIEFKLLWVFANHHKETLSKPFLYQMVLERKFSSYDRSLDMHVSRTRKKLVAAGMTPDQLQTVHGAGYCLS